MDDRVWKMARAAEAGLIGSAAHRIDGVMLEQKQLIGDGPGPPLGDKAVLQRESLLKVDPAQPLDGKVIGAHPLAGFWEYRPYTA
jgi:hypothetical protein